MLILWHQFISRSGDLQMMDMSVGVGLDVNRHQTLKADRFLEGIRPKTMHV